MTVQFVWRSDYEVGDSLIDDQHRYLFDLGNEIQLAGSGEYKRYVMKLYRYIAAHFGSEERHMYANGYPEADLHADLHNRLITKFNTLSLQLTAETFNALVVFLHGWLVDHVLYEDRKYFDYVRQHRDRLSQAAG